MAIKHFQSNPFCTRFVCPGSLPYRFSVDSSDAESDRRCQTMVNQLVGCRFGLIVGPHGTGKSTLLHWLEPRLAESFDSIEYVRLHCPETQADTLVAAAPRRIRSWHENAAKVAKAQASLTGLGRQLLIIDSVEQLSPWSRAKLKGDAAKNDLAVLATSHRPLRHFQILYRTQATEPIVKELAESLLSESAPELRSRIRNELDRRTIDATTNVRDLWFELYDVACR